ncbi:hypothetical protein LPJ53_000581 [Coemansia erecta]|uniref:Uncharacterized protein n=1 Tax=Coemansia erecta TaxID=147472 RepID=A0A9W7Y7K1_9FUNG|nr:hypothetical protein LPJ53_000581 [Coemansia erecta]
MSQRPPLLLLLAGYRGRVLAATDSTRRSSIHFRRIYHQQQQHQQQRAQTTRIADAIISLSDRASNLAEGTWTTSDEQSAAHVLSECRQLVAENPTASTEAIYSICRIADRLGSRLLQQNMTSFSPDVFIQYLELYADLGRPDITQRAFLRIAKQWRQPLIRSFAAQQRAILRLAANGSHLLEKTMGNDGNSQANKKLVTERMYLHSATDIAEDAIRRDKRTRRLVKALEYGSYAALAALVAKWAWIGNSVLATDLTLVPKTLIVAAGMLAGAGCVRLALRYSIMGSLTTPRLSDPLADTRHKDGLKELSAESDSEARRMLRQAFPASPSDETMAEINEMISTVSSSGKGANRLRISWKLRAALTWSRFARRFAVVEPAMISQHGMRQRLALFWLRNITQMYAPGEHPAELADRQAGSDAVVEFVHYVRLHFAAIPLVLSQADIAAMSRFVVVSAGTDALGAFLDLASGGFLALVRGHSVTSIDADAGGADSMMVAEADFHKYQAGAAILAFCGCIQCDIRGQSRTHRRLAIILDKLIDSPTIPISRSLCQLAFQGASMLKDKSRTQATMERLIEWLEMRFEQRDPYFMHLIQTPKSRRLQSQGHSLNGFSPDLNADLPVVKCIDRYIRALPLVSPENADNVCTFVERWRDIGILSPAASLQCLLIAVQADKKPASVISAEVEEPSLDQVASMACRIASDAAGKSDGSRLLLADAALPMYALLTRLLKISSRPANIVAIWQDSAAATPQLKKHASQEFNNSAIRTHVSMALKDTEHGPRYHVKHALQLLDLMRSLGQIPDQNTFDQLCASAARLKIDVSGILEHWTSAVNTKAGARNKKMSEFAKKLF